MASLPRQGIFCLEGLWAAKLTDRSSVLPTLDTLERLRLSTYIHRDVGTPQELDMYLRKWRQKQYQDYEVLYLASHGSPGAIHLGRRSIGFDELADCIDGGAAGRVVYFGSCRVMADRKGAESFQKSTKAKLVCGYRKQVDWVESGAFDLILLSGLVEDARIDGRVNRLRRKYPDLVRLLGFETYPRFDRSP